MRHKRLQRTWKRTKAVEWLLDAKRKIATKEHLTDEDKKQLKKLNKSLDKYFPVQETEQIRQWRKEMGL